MKGTVRGTEPVIEPLILPCNEETRGRGMVLDGEHRGSRGRTAMNAEAMAKAMIAAQYSPEERAEFSRIIRQFVALYYEMSRQTWGTTTWRGVPVCKSVGDLWVYQELISEIKPDLIIETGTCYGGSALYFRDIMELTPWIDGCVLSIDIDHSKIHSRVKILCNEPGTGIYTVTGDSVSEETIEKVKAWIGVRVQSAPPRVMVFLDSDHSAEHVRAELDAYAPLVTSGSILIVEDTYPCTDLVDVISAWLLEHPEFHRNHMCEKYMITFNRDGFLEKS